MNPENEICLQLKDYLSLKIQSSRRLSIRAVARRMNVDPSFLSKVLRGQKSASANLLEKAHSIFPMSPIQYRVLERSILEKKKKTRSVFTNVPEEKFIFISEWYHYAILECSTLKDFQPHAAWVARKLELPETLVESVIGRLIALGHLVIRPDGKWLVPQQLTTTGNTGTGPALKLRQRKVLSKAIDALEKFPLEKRDQSSMTMSISENAIPEAKELITKFRREFMDRIQAKPDDKDSVYELTIAFFPLKGESK